MAALAAAFVVLVTFSGLQGQDHDHWVSCPDQACVDQMVSSAHDSPLLNRLRVYEGPSLYRNPVGGQTPLPPVLDLWLQ